MMQPMQNTPSLYKFWSWTLVLGLAIGAWDSSGLDLPSARWFGNAQGFPLRNNYWLTVILHDGARQAGWMVLIALAALLWRPWGPFKALQRLSTPQRWGLWLSIVAAILAVSVVKGFSHTSCPWDLQFFGGKLPLVSHWDFGMRDGGGGHCFPAGHASTGFAFMAGGFWLLPHQRSWARLWWTLTGLSGLMLGLVQQVRGAHFTSHTLWTAWICWSVGLLCFSLYQRFSSRGTA
jgi:membrane-associated PAP2 superfamily phosphatase